MDRLYLGYDIQNKTVFVTAPNAQTVTLSEKDAPLKEVFKEIKKQTGYDFVYNRSWLEETKKVTLRGRQC